MIGRVAELQDGTFQIQFRMFYFWWHDSIYGPYATLIEAIDYLKRTCPAPRAKVKRIVFP